ncbi:ATP-dependent DNA helicase RecG [Candidatus Gottesmanbacteria bacterium RIFCSPHIGHO2_02_FULL_40_24]|nr:MAG: ATP-dependent DNA helicase RecG [Candidatus Gottesmanbacteria bacterium RIFCSPHIGHO2_02_FULL_40_24]
MGLKTPIRELKMVGPSYLVKLKKLGLETVEDLLFYLPSRYLNFARIQKIAGLREGETATVLVTVRDFVNIFTKSGKKIQKVTVADDSGSLPVIFFNQTYLQKIFTPGVKLMVAGQIKRFIKDYALIAPQYEFYKSGEAPFHTGRLVPVYRETEGVTSKWIRTRIAVLLTKLKPLVSEFLPPQILKKYGLMTLNQAVLKAHFPKSLDEAQKARKRFCFDEFLMIHLNSLFAKQINPDKNKFVADIVKHTEALNIFLDNLPFALTDAQKRVLFEITADMSKDIPMNRLLQGDVGSGKTVVAAAIIYLISLCKFKSVLMAPTEILARQHFQTLTRFFKPYGLKIAFITGKEKSKTDDNYKDIAVIIGTHALLHQKLPAENIALIIIDEQQRFGVRQRSSIRQKGYNPHQLSMTATPIPRTVALTLYSDLNLSVIDELPQGRKKIKTFVVPPEKRQAAYNWIRNQVGNKNAPSPQQAFIICPFIEESETLSTVRAASQEYLKLKNEIFPDLKLGLVHGRLKSDEKDKILGRFRQGHLNILVATPVVEVGIDIKNATIIMIEAAERFGLSQLHQLRGRVGRDNQESFCLLFTEKDDPEIIERLKTMEKYHIGIKLAEYDLKKRGPGQLYGIHQHGSLGLKYADITDLPLIKISKQAAVELAGDKNLMNNPYLQEKLLQYKIEANSQD